MGTPSFRRPQRRRTLQDIERSRASWSFFFYCWRSLLLLVPATVQAVEIVVALIEGRHPHLVVQLPRLWELPSRGSGPTP